MSDCRFGVSPVNYPDPDPELANGFSILVSHNLNDFSSIKHYFKNTYFYINDFISDE